MADETRKPSKSRFATNIVEKDASVQKMIPPRPALPNSPSSDDIERVEELDRLERERVKLLLEKQELEQENARLRKEGRTEVFPPISIPPAPVAPQIVISEAGDLDIAKLKKLIARSPWGRRAVVVGILAALAWNAFNTARSMVPIQKSEATQARVEQNEKLSEEKIQKAFQKDQITMQALAALRCYAKQTRGGFQRQGLDLTSLPSGGIKVTRVGEEDPNRVGAQPRFIVEEKCPDFPKLPDDTR